MDDQICPRCKTSKFGNPSLKLMVNVCGHPLCEACVDILFARGSANCLECGVALRRGNFRAQLYEDSYVEKELDIRRKVLKDFNKQEADFRTLREYNDYLEEVETIIFNLANNIDVEATKKRIENYKKDNKDVISRNRTRLSVDEQEILDLLELEKMTSESRRREATEAEIRQKQLKARLKDELLREFTTSDKSAEEIVAKVQSLQRDEMDTKPAPVYKPDLKRSSGLTPGIGALRAPKSPPPPPPVEVLPRYVYVKPVKDWCGPTPPESLALPNYPKLLQYDAPTVAGGFTNQLSSLRALQEAMGGLFFAPPKGRKLPTIEDFED